MMMHNIAACAYAIYHALAIDGIFATLLTCATFGVALTAMGASRFRSSVSCGGLVRREQRCV